MPPGAIGSTFYPARGAVLVSGSGRRARADARDRSGRDRQRRRLVVGARVGRGRPARGPSPRRGRARGSRCRSTSSRGAGRTPAAVVDALPELRSLGIRDVYVYDSTREPDDEWRAASTGSTGMRVFANTSLPGKALKGGFDGLYTYDVLVNDGSAFGRMCASARELGLACAPSVGPGFDATRATGETRVRKRRDGRFYDHMWSSAIRARPDVVTITSYNEWHEGTQIEPARVSPGPYESYDGAWGLTGRKARSGVPRPHRVLGRPARSHRPVWRGSVERGREPATVASRPRGRPGRCRSKSATATSRSRSRSGALGRGHGVDEQGERALGVARVERLDDLGQLAARAQLLDQLVGARRLEDARRGTARPRWATGRRRTPSRPCRRETP